MLTQFSLTLSIFCFEGVDDDDGWSEKLVNQKATVYMKNTPVLFVTTNKGSRQKNIFLMAVPLRGGGG